MYTAQKDTKKLKVRSFCKEGLLLRLAHFFFPQIVLFTSPMQRLYERSLRIKSAIPHPFIMGIVRGKGLRRSKISYAPRFDQKFVIPLPFSRFPSRVWRQNALGGRAVGQGIRRFLRGEIRFWGTLHRQKLLGLSLGSVLSLAQAFKNYDESGSPKKVTCLKYLVLANMLMKSNVDPFHAQEVRWLSRGKEQSEVWILMHFFCPLP